MESEIEAKEVAVGKEIKVRATILKSNKINSNGSHKIPCILYKESCINNGLIIYFHGNAEDIGMSFGIARVLTMEL